MYYVKQHTSQAIEYHEFKKKMLLGCLFWFCFLLMCGVFLSYIGIIKEDYCQRLTTGATWDACGKYWVFFSSFKPLDCLWECQYNVQRTALRLGTLRENYSGEGCLLVLPIQGGDHCSCFSCFLAVCICC